MKKITSILLALTLLLGIVAIVPFSANADLANDIASAIGVSLQ